MRQVKPSWHGAVFVCTHERPPESGRASCGHEAGMRLRQALKQRAKNDAVSDQLLCAKSGCLGLCSPLGTTVVFDPHPDRGERGMLVFEHATDHVDQLWDEVKRRLAPTR